jgi:probable HAF family extracellular repeat protein
MRSFVLGLVPFTMMFSSVPYVQADTFHFSIIDVPGAYATAASGINDAGQIVGNFSAVGLGGVSAFLDSRGIFTSILAGSGANANAINNSGQIVGQFFNTPSTFQGFWAGGNTITTITVPGADLTAAYGINNMGQIVGAYWGFGVHGFVEKNGAFTTIDMPNSIQTIASGINDRGDIVGYYEDNTGQQHGFLNSGGIVTSIKVTGAVDTFALGVNKHGQVVGYYTVQSGAELHGFLYSNGLFTFIDVPYVNNWTFVRESTIEARSWAHGRTLRAMDMDF